MASRSARKRSQAGRVAPFEGKPRRILGYARVSSALQARGSSLDSQQASMRAHAVRLGMEVAHFYVEAESSVREKLEFRVQMQALLAEVRAGDLVLCDKLDRWSRDPEFSYQSIRQILEAGARFYSVSDGCDPSTNEGDSMLNFRIAFAREEHKRIRERTVGQRQGLRDQGYYTEGNPPFGYRRALGKGERNPQKKNTLVIEAAEAEVVREVFRLCAAGRSIDKIAADLDITRDLVTGMLGRRLYVGEIENTEGAWIAGKHPPLIDADLYDRAQAALSARRLGGPRPRDHRGTTAGWILRDVARCALCGARMASAFAGRQADGSYRRHYYRCAHDEADRERRGLTRCKAPFVAVAAIEAEAEALVLERLAELREELAAPPKATPRKTLDEAELADKRAKLARKRERFLEAFGDGLMTRDELRERIAKLDAEALRIDAAVAAAKRQNPLEDAARRRSILRTVSKIRAAWAKAKPEVRRTEIVEQLVVEARMAAGRELEIVWRSAEELAERA